MSIKNKFILVSLYISFVMSCVVSTGFNIILTPDFILIPLILGVGISIGYLYFIVENENRT